MSTGWSAWTPTWPRRPGAGTGRRRRWDALVGSHGRLGSRSLRAALPHRDGLAVLTWPVGPPVDLDPTTVREVLSAAQRGHDVVVADLPRHLDPVSLEVASRCDRVLLVAEPSVAGVASAGKVAAGLRPVNDDLGVVVRVGGAAVPAGHVADILELPLVAELAGTSAGSTSTSTWVSGPCTRAGPRWPGRRGRPSTTWPAAVRGRGGRVSARPVPQSARQSVPSAG